MSLQVSYLNSGLLRWTNSSYVSYRPGLGRLSGRLPLFFICCSLCAIFAIGVMPLKSATFPVPEAIAASRLGMAMRIGRSAFSPSPTQCWPPKAYWSVSTAQPTNDLGVTPRSLRPGATSNWGWNELKKPTLTWIGVQGIEIHQRSLPKKR